MELAWYSQEEHMFSGKMIVGIPELKNRVEHRTKLLSFCWAIECTILTNERRESFYTIEIQPIELDEIF